MQRIRFIDTHTGGEPTRVIMSSSMTFSSSDPAVCREEFRERYDNLRRALACEPRGNDVMVGALWLPAYHSDSVASVVFFNNVGYLGMCGHGTIGLAVALQHAGQIDVGLHRLDTPVGTVQFELAEDGLVHLQNVPSYRFQRQVPVRLRDGRTVQGDIAWGGNWFYICDDHGIQVDISHLPELESLACDIRDSLARQGTTDEVGAEVDHIELIGDATSSEIADTRSFVLCPGGAYDRSPCGTGTSAKVACLAADGRLAIGAKFRQQSIVGSVFEASYRPLEDDRVLPTISGTAFVLAEGELLIDPRDPFGMGIPR